VVEATSEDKKFWGESENAVRIQIYTAITAYGMMAIVQKKMGIDRPIRDATTSKCFISRV